MEGAAAVSVSNNNWYTSAGAFNPDMPKTFEEAKVLINVLYKERGQVFKSLTDSLTKNESAAMMLENVRLKRELANTKYELEQLEQEIEQLKDKATNILKRIKNDRDRQ